MTNADLHAHTGSSMQEMLDDVCIAIVCGSGGVGKTSIAAAIAVNEALRGRKVCVLTVDPARRLADAMGLSALDDRERQVTLPAPTSNGRSPAAPGGELWALMLDPKKALDRLVAETAPDDEARERIYANHIYQHLSTSASGMQEYMALERLYEIDRADRYDLVVVDTPPTAHARDLLDSPYRMLRFLQGKSLRWLLKPGMRMGRFGLKAIGGSGGTVVNLVTRVTGAETLRETTEFFEAFEGMYDTFTDRIKIVDRLFGDERTGFLVVTSPEREAISESIEFRSMLVRQRYRFRGAVVNRVEPLVAGDAAREQELAALPGISDALATTICAARDDHALVAVRDRERIGELAHAVNEAAVVTVPRLPRLINDVEGLAGLAPFLYDS